MLADVLEASEDRRARVQFWVDECVVAARPDLKQQIQALADKRDGFLSEKVEEAGGLESSLDQQIYRTIQEQAGEAGLDYDDGPSY